MHTILDLDLDVFTSPTVYMPHGPDRPSDQRYAAAAVGDVRHFLEAQCGLNKEHKLPGQEFTNHDDAFLVWDRWIREGSLQTPFSIVHVDAHADMGMGDSGYLYLLSEILALQPDQRSNPRRGHDAMNAGNYLMFAIANRWVNHLTYIFPLQSPWCANWKSGVEHEIENDQNGDSAPGDLMVMHLRDGDWRTGLIELRHCTRDTLWRCLGRRTIEPVIRTEPPVEFDFKSIRRFTFSGFTHMVVAKSPAYVPPAADALLAVIAQYFTAA